MHYKRMGYYDIWVSVQFTHFLIAATFAKLQAGISYGTVLGQTVAAMFPDRMDKVVLDGNLNVHDYYAGR